MSIAPYPIQVLRLGHWTTVQTDTLLPGDVVSVTREDERPVPADILVLDGTCIANEAMLSGESTPQLKDPISQRDEADVLRVSTDRAHVLFGGTRVLQVTPSPRAPAGCLGLVLRTGFATQQVFIFCF